MTSSSAAPNLKLGLKRMRGAARGRRGLRPPMKEVNSLKLPIVTRSRQRRSSLMSVRVVCCQPESILPWQAS